MWQFLHSFERLAELLREYDMVRLLRQPPRRPNACIHSQQGALRTQVTSFNVVVCVLRAMQFAELHGELSVLSRTVSRCWLGRRPWEGAGCHLAQARLPLLLRFAWR